MEARAVVVRRCGNSFCREEGHTVRNCPHPFLETFKNTTNLVSKYSVGMNRRTFIKDWLRMANVNLLKLLIPGPRSPGSSRRLTEVLLIKYYDEVLAAGDGDETDRRQRVLQTMTMEERESMRVKMNRSFMYHDVPNPAPAALSLIHISEPTRPY